MFGYEVKYLKNSNVIEDWMILKKKIDVGKMIEKFCIFVYYYSFGSVMGFCRC